MFIPGPGEGRATKRLRIAWYILGDRTIEGSQEGTELWVLVTLVRFQSPCCVVNWGSFPRGQ